MGNRIFKGLALATLAVCLVIFFATHSWHRVEDVSIQNVPPTIVHVNLVNYSLYAGDEIIALCTVPDNINEPCFDPRERQVMANTRISIDSTDPDRPFHAYASYSFAPYPKPFTPDGTLEFTSLDADFVPDSDVRIKTFTVYQFEDTTVGRQNPINADPRPN